MYINFATNLVINLNYVYALVPVHLLFLTFYCIMISGFCTNEMAYADMKYISDRLYECIISDNFFSQNLPWIFACWVTVSSYQSYITWKILISRARSTSPQSLLFFDVICFIAKLCFFYVCAGVCIVIRYDQDSLGQNHFTGVLFLIAGFFVIHLLSCIVLHIVLQDLKLQSRYYYLAIDYDEMDVFYLIFCVGFGLFYILNLRSWAVLTENVLAVYIFFLTVLNWFVLVSLTKENLKRGRVIQDIGTSTTCKKNYKAELFLFTLCCFFPYILVWT